MSLLPAVTRYGIDHTGALVLTTANATTIVARRQEVPVTVPMPEPVLVRPGVTEFDVTSGHRCPV